MTKNKVAGIILQIVVLFLGFIYILPILSTINNSFKNMAEISTSYNELAKTIYFDNYAKVIEETKYFKAFINSVIVCGFSLAGIILITVMASYAIVRRNSKFTSTFYILFVMGLVMPFTTIMIPTMKIVGALHINGKLGLILIYCALGISLALFLFCGFIRSSVPFELEEAARIDGAGSFRIFFKIVLPLMKPSIMTVVMIDAIWIWNDFLLPSLMLSGKDNRTLPLSQMTLVGQYVQKWDLQFAAFTLSMLPLFILFFSCQKYIIKGVAAGSVKG